MDSRSNNRNEYAPESTDFRRSVYFLLARIFTDVPDALLLKQLQSAGIFEEMARHGFNVGLPDSGPLDSLLDELEIEYTKTFIQSDAHVPLYGSVHSPKEGDRGRLWGDSTVEVKKMIEAAGLEFAPHYGGIPDHLSIELEFLGRLVEAEGKAAEKQDQKTVLKLRYVEAQFIRENLLSWFPDFASKVTERDPHPFYGSFVKFCGEWLLSELDALKHA